MMKSTNVVMLLTDGFGGFGGIAKFNRDFMRALAASDTVERINAFPRLIPELIDESIPESVVYDRKAAQGKVAFMRRLLWYVWRGSKPDLVICGHLNLLPAAWLMAKLRGARLALIIHGIDAWYRRNWLFRFMLRSVGSTLAVSHYSAERFRAWSKVSADRCFVLPNCVDVEKFIPEQRDLTLAERYGVRDDQMLLTVGRLSSRERYKGFDETMEVMPELIRRIPRLKYMIVGDGDDRDRLQRKAASLGISERVIFAGKILEHEKVAHYNLADAFVMPSYGEGFGIVLLEAVSCGVPAIGSKVDGSREALLDGKLGRLVDPKMPDELIEAIVEALNGSVRRERNSAIMLFDVAHFDTRVTNWLENVRDPLGVERSGQISVHGP